MSTAKRITDPRGRILAAIRTSMKERGYPPTVRELGEAVGLSSTSSVTHHLRVLREQGLITRAPGFARALVIADIHPESEAAPDAPGAAPDPKKGIHS